MSSIRIEHVNQLRRLGLLPPLAFDLWVNPDSTDWLDILENPRKERMFAESWSLPDGRYLTKVKALIRTLDDPSSMESYVNFKLSDGTSARVVFKPTDSSVKIIIEGRHEFGPYSMSDLVNEMVRTNKILEPVLNWADDVF